MARTPFPTQNTIYGVMERRGVFASNPANVGATSEDGQNLYLGPQPYPKMLYHPQGEMRVLVRGELVKDVAGDVHLVGQQTEIIHRVVANRKEHEELRKLGWHDHPAKALEARAALHPSEGIVIPQISAGARIGSLEDENALLKRQLAALQAKMEQREDEDDDDLLESAKASAGGRKASN